MIKASLTSPVMQDDWSEADPSIRLRRLAGRADHVFEAGRGRPGR